MNLPLGWRDALLSEIAVIQGGIQKQGKRAPRENKYPFLRVANVTAKGLNLKEVHEVELFGEEIETYRLQRGDLLVVEGNGSASQIGRAAVWDGSIADAVHQNHLIRVRPGPDLDERYLGLVWNSPRVRDELTAVASSTSGLHTLSVRKLKAIRLPLPTMREQRRIVEILEDHLSRLDAADSYLDAAERRAERLLTSALMQATHGLAGATAVRLDAVADVRLGRQRSPKNHAGERMRPYLRAANVDWNQLRLDDVKEMNFSEAEERIYRLEQGDILLTEASGSASEVGKSVIYNGEPAGVCFQNTLIRVRCTAANPEFVQKYLLADALAGRFMPESRGVGINHLGRARLASLTLELPDLAEQASAVHRVGDAMESVARLQAEVRLQRAKASTLRRGMLAVAFSGGLTGAVSDTDLIEAQSANEEDSVTAVVRDHEGALR